MRAGDQAATPPAPTPTPAAANDPIGLVAARTAYIEQAEKARDVLKEAKHRKWAKAISKYALGGESVRFFAEDDAGKLAKIITALKNDFDANGLGLDVFDLNDTAREVHPAVNGAQEPSMLAFTHAGGDDEDAPPPTQEEVTEAWLAEADRVCAESEAVAQRGRQAQADARERAVQESLAAQERSVTAALAAQSRDAEELFMPATWRPDDEKKNEQQQAVVPARCNEAAPQPAVLPADGGAAAAGGELAAGGAGTYEIYNDNAAGFGDEDEYED
ncbi:hypothetical protein CYMTET_29753 [Cymbomonas tetramitiformis]|uniref:Uncharacterized protein n=1 Tax=Cymbomonas tetramitiformis TaxID=36881 RepID=A0AAE0FKC5_9CHLO|nr:hypothetical protein CYMTET_29753 [Cymbomonas tetramitiformis]